MPQQRKSKVALRPDFNGPKKHRDVLSEAEVRLDALANAFENYCAR